jgi:5-methylcytosine-specific restriction enzyme subunit McrC
MVPSLAIAPARGREGCYELTPGSTIGAVRLPGLSIEIRPKIPIDRVLFLLSYALDPRSWRTMSFDFEERRGILEAVVEAFLRQVRQAFRRGVLQGYRSEEEALQGVRGRIRLDDHLRRRFGLAPPVEVRYDEFTEDIEPNRLILAAADRLERLRLRSEGSRAALRWIRNALERVSLQEYHPARLPEIAWTRLNEHYRWAVELARLILRGTTFDLQHGGVRASALLIDMNEVFELFVVTALREALRLSPLAFPRGATGKSLWLDRARAVRLEPDLSWWDGGRCLFVGDVKYKRIRVHGVKHPDLYQLLAYTVAAGLDGGLLIYAAGEGEPVVHEVVEPGKRLEVMTLDLTGGPEEILRQVQRVAARVSELRAAAEASAAAPEPYLAAPEASAVAAEPSVVTAEPSTMAAERSAASS